MQEDSKIKDAGLKMSLDIPEVELQRHTAGYILI